MDAAEVRREVVRRARYALNALAIQDDTVPPEGVFDTAVTNALVAIVASEWPGAEFEEGSERMLPARRLLEQIGETGGSQWVSVDVPTLTEALDLTQPLRHGRSDDEWEGIGHTHVEALLVLDEHPALRVLDRARENRNYGDFIYSLFEKRAGEELPFDPKDRDGFPEPEECDACWRPTFLREGWDMYGGDMAEGTCIACGYERTPAQARDMADAAWFRRQVEKDD